MRRLDLQRQPGWIGGVCAGIASKLGVDVVIVRGVAVVVAVLGGPAFLLYAVAWLLLPDQEGGSHLERMIRGIFDRAIVGIAVIFLLGLLPVSQGFWFLGAGFWGDTSLPGAIGRTLWTLVIIALGIWLVIWIARRANRGSMDAPTTAPATTDDRPETIPNAPAGNAATSAAAAPTAAAANTVAAPSVAPAAPAAGASADELAAWRERQAAWKTEHDAWKKQQAASDRELRQQRSAEARARGAAIAAEHAEQRRRRRLANPRMSGALVAITLGAALLTGGVLASLANASAAWHGHALTVGFGTAAIVLGLVMIIAGAFRRRNGFLGFVSVLVILATGVTAFIPADRTLVGFSYFSEGDTSARYAQPVGKIYIGLNDVTQAASSTTKVIDVWQGFGSVEIVIPSDVTVRVETAQRDGNIDGIQHHTSDGSYLPMKIVKQDRDTEGDQRYSWTNGSHGAPKVTIRIWQGSGSIDIQQNFFDAQPQGDAK